jgi:hypothetical protein
MNIDKLAQTTDFEALNAIQKQEILEQMSESEYHALRETYLGLERLKVKSATLQPDNALKQRLLARFPSPAPSVPLWQRGVPAWAVAASLILVSTLLYFFKNITPLPYPTPVVATKLIHDTIFQEKIVYKPSKIQRIWVHDTVFVVKEMPFVSPIFADDRLPFPYTEEDTLPEVQADFSKGKTVVEDSLTWAILMRIR